MSEFVMQLPHDVLFIIEKMNEAGFSAHVVGGSVRDALIGRECGDIDITTNALPEETKKVFAGYRIIETGIKHGTVTIVLGTDQYEITTYRVDGDYKDGRHPDSVTFTPLLREDLMRRDFTVNAMAYSPESGIVDPFGGREDADIGLIRAVGDPYRRFDEDALRILRALRFAAVLGFKIEDLTAKAIRDCSPKLSLISKERIYTELKKLIMGKDAMRIFTEYSDVIAPMLLDLKIKNLPRKELFDRAELCTRFSAIFLLNSHAPTEHIYYAFNDLKTDKLTRDRVTDAIEVYDAVTFENVIETLKHLANFGRETVEDTLKLGALLERFGQMEEKIYKEALDSGIPYTISGLDVRGGDISSLGLKGERIGEALKSLLYAVINGDVKNERDALLSYIKKEICTP